MQQRDQPGSKPARQSGDDLQEITGIGRATEQRLWDAGILAYKDLARRTPEEIAVHVPGISPERIASQNWIGQARELAGIPPEPSVQRQHYVTFHVEFLLESDNRVRRTKVHHHQTGAKGTWPGWDEGRLLAYLRDRIPITELPLPAGAPDLAPPAMESPGPPQVGAPPTPASEPSTAAPPEGPSALPEDLPASFLSIEELTPIHDSERSHIRRLGEPNPVRLMMRLNPIDKPIPDTFDFSAAIAARMLGGHDRVPVGTANGVISISNPLTVEVAGPQLPAGLYRMVVTVDIYPANHSPDEPRLYSGSASGDLMQVADAPGSPSAAA
jgi:hypothetical protein